MSITKKYEIRYNKKNKQYVVFEVPPKGLWKIKKTFPKRKEAQDWIDEKTGKKKKRKRK